MGLHVAPRSKFRDPWPCVMLASMWTPLIMICAINNPADCATLTAPVFPTESACHAAILLWGVESAPRLPEGMMVFDVHCFEWGKRL